MSAAVSGRAADPSKKSQVSRITMATLVTPAWCQPHRNGAMCRQGAGGAWGGGGGVEVGRVKEAGVRIPEGLLTSTLHITHGRTTYSALHILLYMT